VPTANCSSARPASRITSAAWFFTTRRSVRAAATEPRSWTSCGPRGLCRASRSTSARSRCPLLPRSRSPKV